MANSAVLELSSIPFDYLIGGPLRAIVNAQTMASIATIEYIQAVGIDDQGDAKTIELKVNKLDAAGVEQKVAVQAPLLAIAPPPSIRIAEATIAFKAKLTDVVTQDRSFTFANKAEVGVNAKIVTVRASSSLQVDAKSNSRREREYSIDISVKVVQDEINAGMAKLLSILENSLK